MRAREMQKLLGVFYKILTSRFGASQLHLCLTYWTAVLVRRILLFLQSILLRFRVRIAHSMYVSRGKITSFTILNCSKHKQRIK